MKWRRCGVEPAEIVDAYKKGSEEKDIPEFVKRALIDAPDGFYVVTQMKPGKPGFELTSVVHPKSFEMEHVPADSRRPTPLIDPQPYSAGSVNRKQT